MNTKEQGRDQRDLMKALKSNDYEGVKMMIKQKTIDLNFVDSQMRCSPLMLEVGRKKFPSIKMMQYLLDHGARINYCDTFGTTALHFLMGNKTLILNITFKFLLSHGANPNATNYKGDSLLHRACICANMNAVRCLLLFCNRQNQSNSLKNEGMKKSNIRTIDVNCINDNGDTPLMLATNKRNVSNKVREELIQILFKFKAEINLVNNQKCSALHFAVKNGLSKVVDLLLHRGADVNIVDDEDLTPLEHACVRKNVKLVRSLLTFHSDANRKNRHGRTTIHALTEFSYSSSCCCAEICFMLLLANGAKVNIQDHNGETPLSYAVRWCLRLSIDLQKKAMIFLISLFIEKSDINIQLCKSIGNLVNGDTILHYAVKHMNWHMVDLILNYGPDLHIRNCYQETARDIANKLDAKDESCKKIIELINKKMETIRSQSYSYMFQSWIMSDGELEQLHRKGRVMTHIPCPPTKKYRQK